MPGLRLVAELGGDGSGYDAMMRRANQTKNQFADSFASLKGVIAGAFSAGAVINFTRELIRWGSEINDISTRLGVTTTRAQELAFAATQSGGDIGDVAQGLTRLADAYERMKAGGPAGQKLVDAFKQLGVSVDDLARLEPDQLLERIGSHLEKTGVQSADTAAMLDLFGRSGGKLIPILSELNAKVKEFNESGLGLDPDQIRQLDKAGDTLAKIWLKIKVVSANMLNNPSWISFTAMHMANLSEWFQREFGAAIDFGKLPMKPSALPDYRFLPSAMPPYKYDDEEERNIDEYNRQRELRDKRTGGVRGVSPTTDALVGIGNFLGRSTALVNNVAAQQLEVARRQLTATYSVRDSIVALGAKLTTQNNGGTLGIPNN